MNTKKVWTWSRVVQDAVEIDVNATPMSGSAYYWYFPKPIHLSRGYATDSCIERCKCFDTRIECLRSREQKLRELRFSAARRHRATVQLVVKELALLETEKVTV